MSIERMTFELVGIENIPNDKNEWALKLFLSCGLSWVYHTPQIYVKILPLCTDTQNL